MELIKLESLSLTYDERVLFKDVNLTVNFGDKIVIQSESGAGKSSFLELIAGLRPMQEGSITYKGVLLTPKNIQSMRNEILMLPQETIFFQDRIIDVIMLPFTFKNNKTPPSDKEISEVLELLDLSHINLNDSCMRLSEGEKERIIIARGLLLKRSFWFADEIFAALDKDNIHEILEIIFKRVPTAIFVLHEPLLLPHFNRVITLSKDGLKE